MSIQGLPSFFRLTVVFVVFFAWQVNGQNKPTEKKGKRLTKNELQSQRFLKSFYGKLKLGQTDSAETILKSNDSLVWKSTSLSKSKLNFDLAKAFESDKQFDKALSTYYTALGDQQNIRSKDQKLALGSILRLYAKAQAADSLSKYLSLALSMDKPEGRISPVFERIRIKSHFLSGYFDSVRLDVDSYKKRNLNVSFPPYLSMIIALMHIKEGRYDEAALELEKIIAHTSSGQDSKIESELLKIDILSNKGKEKESFALARILYESNKLSTTISQEAKGLVLYTFANQLFRNGKYKEALEINGEAIQLLKSFSLENNLYHGRALLLTAMIYNDLTDFGAAQLYLSNAQSVLSRSCGLRNTYADDYLYSLGFVHYSMEKYQEAQKEVDKAIDLQKRIYGSHNIPLAQSFNLKGNIFEKSGKTAISRHYLDSSLVIYKTIVEDKEHPLYGKLFNDIGIVEQRKEVIPASISSYRESLRIFEKLYGKVHPDISIGYTNVASLYRDLEEYPKAFMFIQRALMANCINYKDTSIFSNPVTNIALSDFLLLQTSVLKSHALQEWADSLDKSGNGADALIYYKAAIENYFFCLKVINRLRNSYVSEESKIYLTEKVAFIYEDGINICRTIFKKTKDETYLDKAFAFSEKSKAGLLLSAILESNAKKISGLPDSLLERERQINASINQLDKELFKELKKGKKADPEKLEFYKKSLFEQKGNLISYLNYIETNFQKYYQLKYDDKLTSIKEVQQKMLDKGDKQIVLEYFVGKDSIFVFCISNEKFEIVTVKKDKNFNRYITGLTNAIRYKIGDVFVTCATGLYQQLLKPVEAQIKKKVITVIPDVAFVGLPLQAFLNSDKPEQMEKLVAKGKYSHMPFAVFKNAMSYEISAAVALQNASTRIKDTLDKVYPHRLFVLAPVFEPNSKKGYIAESMPAALPRLELDTAKYNYSSHKTHLAQLPGTEQEALSLVQLFQKKKSPARAYVYNFAQRGLVQSKGLSYYNYIHFATHGELNLSRSEYSGLYLNEKDSTSKDGLFNLGNVYTLDLKAKLVTLSACESGLGKVINGEGIMGFARAFTYSGTESILVSLWNLNDPAAAVLMKSFYKNIFKTTYKSEALQKAQSKLARNSKTQSPYFWAPFVIYGK